VLATAHAGQTLANRRAPGRALFRAQRDFRRLTSPSRKVPSTREAQPRLRTAAPEPKPAPARAPFVLFRGRPANVGRQARRAPPPLMKNNRFSPIEYNHKRIRMERRTVSALT